MKKFSISSDKVHLFRLDGIKVKVEPVIDKNKDIVSKERALCRSDKWSIRELHGRLNIYENRLKSYSLIFSGFIRKAILFDKYLLVVCDDVYLLKYDNEGWEFIRELEPIQNQSLFNRRLGRLLHDNDVLIFVYNNRIRKNSLDDEKLIENKAAKNARGMNIFERLL